MSNCFVNKKNLVILGGVFYFAFLLLTPLGVFNEWIPPLLQTGYYSVTAIDPGDDTGYYAYLRSFFFDVDFDFINERNYAHVERINSTGYVFNNWQIGQAVVFFPFFLIGHLLALLLKGIGYPVLVDGYSPPYYFATAVASQTYVFIGLVLLYRILREWFDEKVALVATLSVWLASPLLYFTFIRQRMAHGTEFCFSVVFLWAWLRYRKSDDIWKHALMGAVLGLLCMIRVVNACFLFLYLADRIYLWVSQKENFSSGGWKKEAFNLAAFGVMFALLFLPQLYSWLQLDGNPLLYFQKTADEVKGQSGGSHFWTKLPPKAYQLFFSPKWGLAFATPIWFVGIIGLLFLGGERKYLRPGFLVFTTIMVLLVLNQVDPASFGMRYMIPGMAVFAFGFAALLQKTLQRRWMFELSLAFVILCIVAQYFMIAQFTVNIDYNHPTFTFTALSGTPALIRNNPHLITRSTNFLHLLFVERTEPWNYRDTLFLAVFPLLQLVAMAAVIKGVGFAERPGEPGPDFLKHRVAVGLFALLALVLNGIVAVGAPSKTSKEIEARKMFREFVRKGDEFATKGDTETALTLFSKASTLVPEIWTPFFRMGLVYDGRKNFEEANKYYRKVLDAEPDHPGALLNLGNNLKNLGKFDEAENYLKRAVRLNPYFSNVHDSYAQVLAKLNKLTEAERFFQVALALNPSNGKTHFNLAILLNMMKRHEEAVEHLRMAALWGFRHPSLEKMAQSYNITLP